MCVTGTLTHNSLDIDDLDALYPAGEPLPESCPHHHVRTRAFTVLEQHFSGRGDVWVAGNLNLYYSESVRSAVVEPDVMVITGVPAAQLAGAKSYRTFQHGGSVVFVLEVASKETVDADGNDKRTLYAEIGAAEYWRVDPTGGKIHNEVLQGERLHDGHWTPVAVTVDNHGAWRGHSTALDLDIAWRDNELLFHLPGNDQPLNDLARAETAYHDERQSRRAEQEARQAAEARCLAERNARLTEQAARQAAEARCLAERNARLTEQEARREAEAEAATQAAENARLRELLRNHGSPEANPTPDPPG